MAVTSIILILLLFIFFLAYIKYPRSDERIPHVSLREYLPGGLMHSLLKDPHTLTTVMKSLAERYGPVFYAWIGFKRTFMTCVPEDILHMFTSDEFERLTMVTQLFESITPGGFFTMPGDRHKVVRRAMRDKFNTSMLDSFQPSMADAVKELCETLTNAATNIQPDGKSQILDINETIALTTFRVITNVSFGSGMNRVEREQFANTTTTFFEEIMGEVWGYPWRQRLTFLGRRKQFFETRKKVNEVCLKFVQDRITESNEERRGRRQDMLDLFLQLDMDEKTVLSFVVTFLLAGSHTTNQALAWCLYETCCNPRIVVEIEKELEREIGNKPVEEVISMEELNRMGYIHKVWKETLRLHPASPITTRSALSDVTLKGSGVKILKGGGACALIGYANVRKDLWSDAAEFKPERWGYGDVRGEGERVPAGAYVPFGVGRRSCAGRILADYEGPLILAELHRRFRFILGCDVDQVVTCTSFVDTPRYVGGKDGRRDKGIPMRVELR